jgi:alpha-1,6-mannosyltransferase
MKILDVNEFYAERGGGVRTYVHRKLEAAAALGVSVVVVAPGEADREEPRPGGKIVWVKSPKLPLDPRYHVLLRERAVHAIIAAERPSAIEGSSPWAAGWMAARAPGDAPRALVFHQDPVAVYPHTLLDRRFSRASIDGACEPYWAYLRGLASRFDATVVSGAWLEARLSSFGVPRARAVPFGIDKARFHPSKRCAETRAGLLARAGLGEEAKLLVAIGRHHPEKRLGTLLGAMERLAARPSSRGRFGLVLYGDGPLRRWVERRARRIPGVYIAGFTTEPEALPRALASADAFLHGSAAETYGLVVAEALSAGAPLIVPDTGGAADLADPRWAETYRAGDVEACAAAIERLFTRDASALRRATAAARDTRVSDVRAHFEGLFRLYEGLSQRGIANVA